MKLMSFRPKLFDTLKSYSRADFLRDLMAGVIVGIIAAILALAALGAYVYVMNRGKGGRRRR